MKLEEKNLRATGIVRRIDDLGRVVVPKEIRRTLRIREGDPMEIYTDQDGEIILRKYSPIGELSEFARQYAESLAQTTGNIICVSDKTKIIAVSGMAKKEFLGKPINKTLLEIIDNRVIINSRKGEKKFVQITDESDDFQSQVIAPIICEGDTMGAVIITTKDVVQPVGETEVKLAGAAAHFLGKQLEL